MIKIVCGICKNPLSLVGKKSNKKSEIIEVGLCGYCETMAHIIITEVNNTLTKNRREQCKHILEK